MKSNLKISIYISNYNRIGGVERFVTNFIKRMSKHYDITLLYNQVDDVSVLLNASKYCDVKLLDRNSKHETDVFVCSTAWGFSPYNQITAKKYIQMIHACYDYYIKGWNFKYIKHPKTTHHVCVGDTVKEAFEKVTGLKSNATIYNLLDNEICEIKPKKTSKKLKLVTVSRISGEKGFDRMLEMAKQMNEKNIDFLWEIYGDNSHIYAKQVLHKFSKIKNVEFKGITTEPYKVMANSDYTVQLSDSEGYCYSVIESLQVGTPCLITPFSSGKEQVKHGLNGYILDFSMENINFEQIINEIPTFEPYQDRSSEKDWIKLFEL